MRIEVVHLAGAMVAQESVQLLECIRDVPAISPINYVQTLAGVGVIKPESSFFQRAIRPSGNSQNKRSCNCYKY